MKIVILGAGSSGCFAASQLSQKGHDVTLIEKDPQVFDRVSRETDAAITLAAMPDIAVLSNLLESKPDLFFAATGEDVTNLVSCSLAKNLGFPKTVARIKHPRFLRSEFLDIRRLFYVDHLIGSELLTAQDLFKLLMHAGDSAFEHFAHGSVIMRTLVIPPEWKKSNILIKDLKFPPDLIIGLIRRKTSDQSEVFYPHGDDKIEPFDEVTLIGEAHRMNELHELFHIPERRVKSVILVGGSDVALHLSQLLLQQKISVKIIEKNGLRCRFLADQLRTATIIHRDGKDAALFREENIKDADAVVTCTRDDGTNFLASSMALHMGCRQSIALASDPAYVPLYENAKILPALSERINMTNRLFAIMHESSFITVSSLSNDAAKIVELKVPSASPLLGIPLSKLHLPKDLLIAVIENQGKVMIGRGSSILCPDDTAIAICSPDRLEKLHHLFH